MNIDPDQIYHAVEPIDVKRGNQEKDARTVMLECAMCGRKFERHTPNHKFCNDPECVKHRHVVRQMEFYKSRPGYTGKHGRPRTVPEEERSAELRHYYRVKGEPTENRVKTPRKNAVDPTKRSPQLEYYYRKKAGKVDRMEDKLKAI